MRTVVAGSRSSSSSSLSEAREKPVAGVDEHEKSVDSAWMARGEEGAEEGDESANCLDDAGNESLMREAEADV